MELLYARLDYSINELLSSIVYTFPLEFQAKILRLKRWQDFQASLLGRLLLTYGLKKLNLNAYSINNIRYTEYKKPFFDNNIDFSISHSGDYVTCLLSTNLKIGIDIEKHIKIDVRDFYNIFSSAEIDELQCSTNLIQTFYRFWTLKEAALKAEGVGLNYDLKNVNVLGNYSKIGTNQWYLSSHSMIESYSLAIAKNEERNFLLNTEILSSRDIYEFVNQVWQIQ